MVFFFRASSWHEARFFSLFVSFNRVTNGIQCWCKPVRHTTR